MSAYYNENDAEKAAWIRELIRENIVAPGEVDERDIRQVDAADLRGFTQCHFFAGIAVWSYALRLAGWPDDRPCWTGSCPCPSFSCAGKGEGFDDPRHLWPNWYPLICECRPRTIFGEQANDAIGFGWLDLVSTDLEEAGYAFAPAVLGAHSVGAGHKRQRLYFCADSEAAEVLARHGEVQARTGAQVSHRSGNGGLLEHRSNPNGRQSSNRNLQRSGEQRLLAEDCGTGNGEHATRTGEATTEQRGQQCGAIAPGETGECSHALSPRPEGHFGHVRDWRGPGWLDPLTARSVAEAGATRGFWGDCDWWYARDGKYRPIEPGLFPLAHGATNRVLKLRGYGDAICAEVAKAFIEAAMSCMGRDPSSTRRSEGRGENQ